MMGLRLPRPQHKSKIMYVLIVDSDEEGPSNNAVISEEVARGNYEKEYQNKEVTHRTDKRP